MDTSIENYLHNQIDDCIGYINYWNAEVNNPSSTFWPKVSESMLSKSNQNYYHLLSPFS